MNRPLPTTAVILGLLGLLPFLGCSLGALTFSSDGASRSMLGLSAYGAVILAFLGGVHWGWALDPRPETAARVERLRLGLGVVPALVGWAGMLVTFIGLPLIGLAVLAAGFIGLTIVEARGTKAGLVPPGYMWLRWGLSVVVIVCLVSVCLVRLLGGHVVL